MSRAPTPLGAVAKGLIAGAAGTAAMTAWQEAAARLRGSSDDGGEEEGDGGDPWEEAPVPAQAGRRILSGVFGVDVPADSIPVLTNVMHWAYGTGWGAVYGLLAGTRGRSTLAGGLGFGTAVWAASYLQLVPMGLYEPPWKYPPTDLAFDLSYHLAYGAGTAIGFRP
jgi:hypothetical protein